MALLLAEECKLILVCKTCLSRPPCSSVPVAKRSLADTHRQQAWDVRGRPVHATLVIRHLHSRRAAEWRLSVPPTFWDPRRSCGRCVLRGGAVGFHAYASVKWMSSWVVTCVRGRALQRGMRLVQKLTKRKPNIFHFIFEFSFPNNSTGTKTV